MIKKSWIHMVALVAACGLCGADDLGGMLDGNFQKIDNAGQLSSWKKQRTAGTYQLQKNANGNQLKVNGSKGYCLISSKEVFPVKPGDEFTIKLKASGTGFVQFGPIWRKEKRAWNGNGFVTQKVTPLMQEYKHTFKMNDMVKKDTTGFVVTIGVPKGERALIENVQLIFHPESNK